MDRLPEAQTETWFRLSISSGEWNAPGRETC